MFGGPEVGFDPVRQACTQHDEQPSVAYSHQARRKIAEPDARSSIGCEMRTVQVQGQGRPHAPPLPLLYELRVELAYVESIESPQAIGNRECNTDDDQRVAQTAHPGIGMKFRRRRRWRGLVESLQLVLPQMLARSCRVRGIDQQNEFAAISRNGTCNTDRVEHECPLV